LVFHIELLYVYHNTNESAFEPTFQEVRS